MAMSALDGEKAKVIWEPQASYDCLSELSSALDL